MYVFLLHCATAASIDSLKKKKKKKKQQLDFWLPVTGSLEERGNKIGDFQCLSILCMRYLWSQFVVLNSLLAAGTDIDIVMVKARL